MNVIGVEKPDLEELVHYGVLGMKWGVRKDDRSSSGASGESARKRRKAEKKAYKQRVRSERKHIYKDAGRYMNAKKTRNYGSAAAYAALAVPVSGLPGAVLGGLAVGSTAFVRSTGMGRGSSVAIGMLGGPIGAVAVGEIKARSRAKD